MNQWKPLKTYTQLTLGDSAEVERPRRSEPLLGETGRKAAGQEKTNRKTRRNWSNASGMVFGAWTVIRKSEGVNWFCKCECGVIRKVKICNLASGDSESCGCRKRKSQSELFRKHGESGRTAEYVSWLEMKRRCYYKKSIGFKNYGGRGISVCDRWKNSYENFLLDMGRKPSPKHSLDRIDCNGNYEPNNCRWADRKTQMRNMRSNRVLECDGERKTLAEWSEQYKIGFSSILARIRRGWSVEKAIKTKVGKE